MYKYEDIKNIMNKGVGAMRPKFKIGDKVVINDNLVFDKRTNTVNSEMFCYQGMSATIVNIYWDSLNLFYYYLIDLDGGVNKWTFNMLKKVD